MLDNLGVIVMIEVSRGQVPVHLPPMPSPTGDSGGFEPLLNRPLPSHPHCHLAAARETTRSLGGHYRMAAAEHVHPLSNSFPSLRGLNGPAVATSHPRRADRPAPCRPRCDR